MILELVNIKEKIQTYLSIQKKSFCQVISY